MTARRSTFGDRLREPIARRALVRGAAAGLLGGSLAFLLLVPFHLEAGSGDVGAGHPLGVAGFGGAFLPGIVFGATVSAVLVLAEELSSGSAGRMGRKAAGAGIFGALMGAGYSILGYCLVGLFGALLGWAGGVGEGLARAAGWSCFGLGTGLAAGVMSHSGRRSYQGLLGGIAGGFFGGFLFELLPRIESASGLRLGLGFLVLGASVGLATALVEQLGKGAWITFLSGSREGRDVVLHRDTVSLGRDELADVPLFGDALVERRHAVLSLAPSPVIQELSAAPLLRVDGHPARTAALQDGSVVEIGKHRFRFRYHAWLLSTGCTAPPIAAALDHLLSNDPLPPLHPVPAAPAGPSPFPTISSTRSAGTRPSAISHQAGLLLRIAAGPGTGITLPLGGQAVTLGREATNTLPLADSRVSRYHARIEPQGGAWVLSDLSSRNGTTLNGQPVTRAGLAPGDRVLVGDTLIVVEAGGAPGWPAPGGRHS